MVTLKGNMPHACPQCNWQCTCNDQPCSCCGPVVKCRKCKVMLRDRNAKDVGYCLSCFAELMSDEEE
jgi:hypothetical protein